MNEDVQGDIGEGIGEDAEEAQEVQILEREIEEVLRNRISTAEGLRPKGGAAGGHLNLSSAAHTIVNITKGGENSLKVDGGVRQ